MKNPYFIGIAGGSGAGKTRFLRAIREQFTEEQVCIVSQDNYYRPAHEQAKDDNGEINFDRPEGIDDDSFLKDLQLLGQGKAVVKEEYMFNQPGLRGKELVLNPAPVIVAEGLFIFHFPLIRQILDFKVYIEAEENTRLERRLARDRAERGQTHDSVMYMWQNHVLPAYKQYLEPYKNIADLVVDNNINFEMGLTEAAVVINDALL